MLKVGDPVVYVDPVVVPHNAVITAVWSETCLKVVYVNVVYVSGDKSKEDTYGRQIERQTSLLRKDIQTVHGQYWMLPGEEQNPIQQPLEK